MIKLHRLSVLNQESSQQGMILIITLIVITILGVIGLSLMSQTVSEYTLTGNQSFSDNALYVAEAGVEQSIEQLNLNNSFAGYSTPQQFFNNSTEGIGSFTVTVVTSTSNPNAKTITSTGNVYNYNNPTGPPISSRIVQATAVGTTSSGYSVESGPGGLILSGSANITNSAVYVDGTINLSGSSKIGTYSDPLTVDVADNACPAGSNPGSTYPSLCTTQPITMSSNTNIYGSVCATNQTSTGPNNNIQGGSTGQGLELGCTAPTVSPPTYDRQAQINAVTTTASSTSNDYVCSSGTAPFARSWPANLELTGNVDLSNSCNVSLNGNVYITGNLTMNGSAQITTDASVGTTRPVVIVDGTITINGSTTMAANSSGTSVEFISFDSNDTCGATCTSITGSALQATSTFQTINVGGAVKVPGVIFDAYWGEVVLSGSGNVGSAIGQTVYLDGGGTVTFGTTLSSGVSTWTVSSYELRYPDGK